MIFAGGLLLLLADAVDGTRLTWRQKTWATGHGEDGAALPPSIMTEDAVRAIRASTEENSILAERYDRSAKQIRNIRARKAWKNV